MGRDSGGNGGSAGLAQWPESNVTDGQGCCPLSEDPSHRLFLLSPHLPSYLCTSRTVLPCL